jgi:hypothetical protein
LLKTAQRAVTAYVFNADFRRASTEILSRAIRRLAKIIDKLVVRAEEIAEAEE